MLYTKSALEAHADKAAIETAWDPLKPGFYFLTRAAVLDLTATQLQRMQEMRDSKLLVKVLIDLNDAFQGKGLIESVLFVSHRWEDPATPDETGAQLAAIKAHLLDHPEIQFVWFDYSCMPQRSSGLSPDEDDRTPAEKAEFDLMLTAIADLYLTAKVLILLDTMYRSRFWTTMEGWCAMQKVTPQGVRPARAGESRVTVVCIHNATQKDREALLEMSNKTPAEMSKFLASPDVAVTNKKDKVTMLPIVGKTDEHVREMMSGIQIAIPEAHEAELRKDDDPKAALMESLHEVHGERFVVPAAITLEQLEDSKRGVCALLPNGTKYEDWYPPLVLSYASGRRTNRKGVADDCEGSGPGVMYAKGLMEFLHERGLQCFSGLQVPPGVDWETFMLRLTGENGKREKPKVLIIILTAALYQSKPCLKEIDTAIKHEVELLPVRFEDNLPGKAEQWTNLKGQEWEMRKFRVQEKLNALNNIPNPGTVLNRPTSLQDIVAELEKHLPAPASPATSTPTPPPPPPKPPGGPSEGPRFPVGSRVYVDQGHGKESLGVVMTYNAAKGAYVVELGERGSGELDTCFDQDLRKADGPLSQLIDSAGEGGVRLFGIDPMIMEREGATTGSAAASNPTPQPPAHRFKLNERVECRDRGQSWQAGTVVSVEPLMVQPDGWDKGFAWDEVRVLSPEADGPPEAPANAAPTSQPPPPPPGLKLEGGSLTGEAAKYPGTYRLVVGKLVNGRPAYQHTSDATHWIAFDGDSWMGQPESSLGEGTGYLDLTDSAAASPDVSAKIWKANAGGADAEWVEAPQLKCTAWTPPPPPGLKLEGGSLPGKATKYLGTYRLCSGKLVNGRPAYQHTSDATLWIAFDGDDWMGQSEQSLGGTKGFLDLRDPAAASPDVSAKTWRVSGGAGSGWVEAPQLKCTAWTPPPPPGLKLEGGSLPGKATKYLGTYRLYSGKLVNGRPAYQHTTDATLWIAFDGVDSWRGQPESSLGKNRSSLKLIDPAAASPDVSTETWKATAGGADNPWVEAPQLKCTAWTPPPPPPGLKLEASSLEGDAAEYMGGYRLVVGKLVNGRPAYQHTSDATLWIAFAGDRWMGQPELLLGEKKGFLVLRDPAAASPDVSAKTWKAWNGSAWVEAPQLKCTAWTPPPPPGLKLEGGSLPGEAAKYPGTYRLVVGKLVNGRPAYQHVADATFWIAFDGDSWRGQSESVLGEKKGFLFLQDSAAASPDVSIVTWKANAGREGAAWVEAPQLKCTAWTPPPLQPPPPSPAKPTPQPPASPAKPTPQPTPTPPRRSAEEERRAKASAQAAAELRAEKERRAAREAPVKNFRGPCADCCKPLAPCCCVSADGDAIFCCVPTEPKYFLPACLHMALCPQLGCDPRGGEEGMDYWFLVAP
jgi:hypothetical protein